MQSRIALAVAVVWTLGATAPALMAVARAADEQSADRKQNKRKRRKRPVLDYRKYGRSVEIDVQMADKRKAIREQLKTLLKYERDKKERPALLFRLAENYFQEAEAYFFKAMELDDELAEDPTNTALRKRIAAQKKKLRATEDEWRVKAIEQYKQIAEQYPDYPGRDQVLFYLAASLWDLERYKEALSDYKDMINSYPKSKWVPDAYLAFGEYYFDNAKLDKALMAYKKVAEYPNSAVYPYALYKQGWCYFNLHEWEKAKEKYREVVALADMEAGTTGRRIQIRKEALSDFTSTYAHQGSAQAAPRVFQKLAPKEAPDLLVNLASMYFADGKDKKAVILYRWLIDHEKCSADVPFYQGRIVDAASRVGNKRYTVTQVRSLVEKFKQVEQCVENPNARERNKIEEARELADRTLRKLGDTWYKEAKETRDPKSFEYAQEMFGDYLQLFPGSKDAYDIRFAYAELLFHRLGRYERAAVQYTKLVARDLAYLKKHGEFPEGKRDPKKASPPGTYFCDAAYKSMQAHREIMKKERRREKRRLSKAKKKQAAAAEKGKGGKLDKLPIPKYKRRFLKAAEIFLDYCPKDEDILDVKYDIAKTYYDYYHLAQAIQRFDEIVRDFPDSDLANYAANLVLDALNEREDLDRLNEYARKYSKNRKLMKNEKLRTYLADLIPKIAFKRIGALEDKLRQPPEGRKPLPERRIKSKVAYGYIKFWREFPDHELADEALFNASVKYEQAERLDKARKARRLLIDKHPKSDLVPGTIFNLAENYERMADFDKAADLYERYASTYKKMKGLGKAISYKNKRGRRGRKGRRGKQRHKAKEKKEKRFEGNRRTWNLEDAQTALLNAGIYREALHQYAKAISNRQEFVDLFPRAEETPQVYYSLGLLYERLGRYAKAAEVFDNYSKRYMKENLDRAIAAHMKRYEMLRELKRPKWRELERELKTTIALYRKYKRRRKNADLTEAAEAAAHAAFILAEPVYKEYIKYRFTRARRRGAKAQQRHFKKQIEEKIERFKKVEKVYTAVAKRKQPEWAIAALYKIGRAYEDFAQTFYKAPMPKGLTPEQLDLYTGRLRTYGQPYEDKAVTHFEAAVKKGSELGFYSRFTQRALAKLQHYRPAEYPREDLGFALGVISDPASRSPLLLATWKEARKKPELLAEPPLTFKREGEPEPDPAPAAGDRKAQAAAGEPKAAGAGAGQAGAESEGEKPADAFDEPADPAADAWAEDEPEDGFD